MRAASFAGRYDHSGTCGVGIMSYHFSYSELLRGMTANLAQLSRSKYCIGVVWRTSEL